MSPSGMQTQVAEGPEGLLAGVGSGQRSIEREKTRDWTRLKHSCSNTATCPLIPFAHLLNFPYIFLHFPFQGCAQCKFTTAVFSLLGRKHLVSFQIPQDSHSYIVGRTLDWGFKNALFLLFCCPACLLVVASLT